MIVASSASSIQIKNKIPRIVFIGQPNTGKSTFFNTVTKSNAGVANWPGLTVDFMQANLDYNGKTYEFVDLPGIYDLEGFTEDELVVQKFLNYSCRVYRSCLDLIHENHEYEVKLF